MVLNMFSTNAYLILIHLTIAMTMAADPKMKWMDISDTRAICNDLTKSGYFLRHYQNQTKWIIYLESGGFCVSANTCNKRFIKEELRGGDLLDKIDISAIWESKCGPLSDGTYNTTSHACAKDIISPLMTSLRPNETETFSITGQDFMSPSEEENPQFSDFNHVLLPYCSSDLWLGDDSRDFPSSFKYNTTDNINIQFAFRGSTIFRGVIQDLLTDHGLAEAEEIIFIGSSAGGIGVMNHAGWLQNVTTQEKRKSNNSNPLQMSVILDSSWFVDFHETFSQLLLQEATRPDSSNATASQPIDSNELFRAIQHLELCERKNNKDVPCCLLAHCVLNSDHFPRDIPTLMVLSLYDVYVLGVTLRYDSFLINLVNRGSSDQSPSLDLCSDWDPSGNGEILDIGIDVSYLQLVSEYGGTMNSTINNIARSTQQFSYFITSCFQHIYFSPFDSSGSNKSALDSKLFAKSSLSQNFILNNEEKPFWKNVNIPVYPNSLWNNTDSLSIEETILYWRRTFPPVGTNSSFQQLLIRQTCTEPHCARDVCPEKLNYNITSVFSWKDWERAVVATAVLVVLLLSIAVFVCLKIHHCLLKHRQQVFMDSHHPYERLLSEQEYGPLSFPSVGGYSIACKNLSYSVSFQRSKHKIAEETRLLVLAEVDPDLNHGQLEEYGDETLFENFIHSTFRDGEIDESASIPAKLGPKVEVRKPPDGNSVRKPQQVRDYYTYPGKEYRASYNDNLEKSIEASDHSTLNSTSKISLTNGLGTGRPARGLTRSQTQTSIKLARNYVGASVAQIRSSSTVSRVEATLSKKKQTILKNVSLYFNPGELVAIMGPSGCGKTTLLDILTGRRTTGQIEGEVLINGYDLDYIRKDYNKVTGYLMQLTFPFYEELTVRENLTLAAQLRLPKSHSLTQIFDRVEKILHVVQLHEKADVKVGNSFGPGLSGGQKRKLSIAIQLLREPQVLVLDEPTSGLDANASFDLLGMLNQLSKSKRTIILTIHQPRLEIFHMFHKIVFLCEGQVAYFGQPSQAYEVCTMALKRKFASKNQVIPGLEDQNPADIIVDMLGNHKFRNILIEHYNQSREPKWVRRAINAATKDANISISRKESTDGGSPLGRGGANVISRLSAFEARAAKRASFPQLAYLPAIFIIYGTLLGTVYLNTESAFLVVSGFCVYSVASALFMFPIMHLYYDKTLALYKIEHMDGVGWAYDLIVQGFTRFVTLAFIPVILCAAILYLLAMREDQYNLLVFLQLVLVNLALNQTWIALLLFVITGFPTYAIRLSPVISAVAGFASGFFVPIGQMPPWYCWLFYINPNFYGFSSTAYILLSNFNNNCTKSELECYIGSGDYILRQFQFDQINPYLNILILLCMTLFFLCASVVAMALRHTNLFLLVKQLQAQAKVRCQTREERERMLSRHSQTKLNETEMGSLASRSREARPSLIKDTLPKMYTHAQNLTPVASEDDLTVTEDGLSTADELDSGGEDEQLLEYLDESFGVFSDEEQDAPQQLPLIMESSEGRNLHPTIPLYGIEEVDYTNFEQQSTDIRAISTPTPTTPTSPIPTTPTSPIPTTPTSPIPATPTSIIPEKNKRKVSIANEHQGPVALSTNDREVPMRHSSTDKEPTLRPVSDHPAISPRPPRVGGRPSQHGKGEGGRVYQGPPRTVACRRGRSKYKSLYLQDGMSHQVWLPKAERDMAAEQTIHKIHNQHTPLNQSLSAGSMYTQATEINNTPVAEMTLQECRLELESRIKAAQEVGRHVTNEIVRGKQNLSNQKSLRHFTKMITKHQKGSAVQPSDYETFEQPAFQEPKQLEEVDGHPLHKKVLAKSPSVPAGISPAHAVRVAEPYPEGFDSLKKRKHRGNAGKMRPGMRKQLVGTQGRAQPLPIKVYKALLDPSIHIENASARSSRMTKSQSLVVEDQAPEIAEIERTQPRLSSAFSPTKDTP